MYIVPRLMRANANSSPRRVRPSSKTIPSIIDQFAFYPYFNYAKLLVDGYIHRAFKCIYSRYTVSFIADLCKLYVYNPEDGYDQLTYQIFGVFKKFDEQFLPDVLLKLIIRKYLKIEKSGSDYEARARIQHHCNELIRLKYIIPTDKTNNQNEQLYTFSISAKLMYDR